MPTGPSDEIWNQVPEYAAELIPQDQVDPRRMERSTGELRTRALTDACAVQLPARFEPTIPAPQMGESGRPVHITYWSAVWQTALEVRRDSLEDLYPNATIDYYPFEAPSLEASPQEQRAMALRYAPAQVAFARYGSGLPQST